MPGHHLTKQSTTCFLNIFAENLICFYLWNGLSYRKFFLITKSFYRSTQLFSILIQLPYHLTSSQPHRQLPCIQSYFSHDWSSIQRPTHGPHAQDDTTSEFLTSFPSFFQADEMSATFLRYFSLYINKLNLLRLFIKYKFYF